MLAVLPSAAIVLDAGDDVVKASPAAYTFGLVRGHSLSSAEMLAVVERVRARGLIEEIDLEQKRETSESVLRYLHARVAPLGTAFILVLCDDQTESKRVDAVRRDFVANVSHELKTPIGAMALLAEAVTDFSDDPQAVERFGGRMQRESKRLTQLVQEIIDLSRVQDHAAPSRPRRSPPPRWSRTPPTALTPVRRRSGSTSRSPRLRLCSSKATTNCSSMRCATSSTTPSTTLPTAPVWASGSNSSTNAWRSR